MSLIIIICLREYLGYYKSERDKNKLGFFGGGKASLRLGDQCGMMIHEKWLAFYITDVLLIDVFRVLLVKLN